MLPAGRFGSAYTAKLQGAGGTIPLTWNRDPPARRPDHRPRRDDNQRHPHRCRARSRSPHRSPTRYNSSVSRTFTLIVVGVGAPPPAARAPRLSGSSKPPTSGVRTKLTRLVNPSPRSRRKGVPIGTTFTFTRQSSGARDVTFRHATQGRRVSGTASRGDRNASRPRCTRTLTDGALRVQAPVGTIRLASKAASSDEETQDRHAQRRPRRPGTSRQEHRRRRPCASRSRRGGFELAPCIARGGDFAASSLASTVGITAAAGTTAAAAGVPGRCSPTTTTSPAGWGAQTNNGTRVPESRAGVARAARPGPEPSSRCSGRRNSRALFVTAKQTSLFGLGPGSSDMGELGCRARPDATPVRPDADMAPLQGLISTVAQ